MKIKFIGEVSPAEYAVGNYYVEGVGDSIRLINENPLNLVAPYSQSFSVLFDSVPFDKQPFSDASSYPGIPDYLTINRGSQDRNPWSRYNRWFHKDVIELSATINGKVPDFDQDLRAKRPIIEFESNIRMFNYGTKAIDDVDHN